MHELSELFERLNGKTDVEKYRGRHSKPYASSDVSIGYTVIPVLAFLWGLPLSDLVLSYLHGLRPSAIRVTGGEVTADAMPWRVTVYVDKHDVVTDIKQEVMVLYGCGVDISNCLDAVKNKTRPQPQGNCFGNADAIKRVNFE